LDAKRYSSQGWRFHIRSQRDPMSACLDVVIDTIFVEGLRQHSDIQRLNEICAERAPLGGSMNHAL